MNVPTKLIGIDVGGTFTDILCYDKVERSLLSAKVTSVAERQWEGVLQAIATLGIASESIVAFVHGTTIATNAVLEKKGAKTGLVTTDGFRDVLEIGLTRRLVGGLFDIKFVRQPPLVGRELRFEVPERTTSDGSVLQEVNGFDFGDASKLFKESGVETIAICFINSYANQANEKAAAEALGRLLPGIPISQSSSLIPERGEFGRCSTVVLNAYLTPTILKYLNALSSNLENRKISAPVTIMTSNGGAMTLDRAAKNVVATFLSGPVGGVNGAIRICQMNGIANCITFDMGGTSTDVALVHNLMSRTSHFNQIGAFPVVWPQLDIHTIGAGGGSIISVQKDGTIEVGPQSAGAIPGPVCYKRGGTSVTISDANLLLGRLPSTHPISGGLQLSVDAARKAVVALALEAKLGADKIYELSESAIRIAIAKMAAAVREVSVHRGYDPREFVLIGFGGAGPMHALFVAEELSIHRVLLPPMPGHLSAYGQMLADHRLDFVNVWGGRVSELPFQLLQEKIIELRRRAAVQLEHDGFVEARHKYAFTLDLRYVGQSFTLSISWQDGYDTWAPLVAEFNKRHDETFGYSASSSDLELINVRLAAFGLTDKPEVAFPVSSDHNPKTERRQVWFNGRFEECLVYSRDTIPVEFVINGPAIIDEAGCTSVIPPGWRVTALSTGALDCVNEKI